MATETTKIPYVEGAAPATPAAGRTVTYAKADGLMYSKDDAGVETLMSGGTAATRASLGLDTTDSPQFAGLNIGAATDTTVIRTGAGDIAVEGNAIYRAGGTDVPVADGGTGASSAATARSNLGALADTDAITYLDGTVAAAPATPAAGKLRVYAKTGKVLAVKDDAGLETVFGSGIADQGAFTFLDATEAAAPATPASGKVRIYAKADGRIYSKDDAGVESGPFDAAGGGSSATSDFFEGPSLGAWWTDPATSAAGQTNVLNFDDPFGLAIQGLTANKHFYGISQVAPAGDFTVMALLSRGQSGTDMRSGLYVAIPGGKGHVVGPFEQDGAGGIIGVTTTSETADWSGYDGYLSGFSLSLNNWSWYRITWDSASSELRFYQSNISGDPTSWGTAVVRTGQSQPTRMGVCLYSNGGTAGGTSGGIKIARFIVTEP